MIALNAAVADQLKKFKEVVDARIAAGTPKEKAILDEVKKIFVATRAIHFDGNGYSDEWREEAARRGLDCESSVPKILILTCCRKAFRCSRIPVSSLKSNLRPAMK